ncbi:MAG: hypothetical protein HFF84_02495 [Oscillibacter sp.]|nr:hypothetical protein [Oscillibacter sp.]
MTGDRMTAAGTVLKAGKSFVVSEAEVTSNESTLPQNQPIWKPFQYSCQTHT